MGIKEPSRESGFLSHKEHPNLNTSCSSIGKDLLLFSKYYFELLPKVRWSLAHWFPIPQ